MALSNSMTSWVATVMTQVTVGMMTNGTKALASTVVVSETGNDFQNRMLRSRRSAYRAFSA
jgi:hypothetical protein